MQKTILVGRLTANPEMRYTPAGTAVTNFTVVTSETVSKDKFCPEGWKESYNKRNWELATFWKITAWRGQAEACNQYLSKGAQVYVEGTVNGTAVNGAQHPRVWTGNDGVAKASFELTARNVEFITRGEDRDVSSDDDTDNPFEGEESQGISF